MPFRQKFHVLFDKRRVILAGGHLITPFRQTFMLSSMNEESFWPVAISSCLWRSLVSHVATSHMPAGQPFRLLDKAGVQRTVLIPHLKVIAVRLQ